MPTHLSVQKKDLFYFWPSPHKYEGALLSLGEGGISPWHGLAHNKQYIFTENIICPLHSRLWRAWLPILIFKSSAYAITDTILSILRAFLFCFVLFFSLRVNIWICQHVGKNWPWVSSAKWCIYNTIHAPKAQGTSWKWEQKDCMNQRIRISAMKYCLLYIT